jgi:hypothetical protein
MFNTEQIDFLEKFANLHILKKQVFDMVSELDSFRSDPVNIEFPTFENDISTKIDLIDQKKIQINTLENSLFFES